MRDSHKVGQRFSPCGPGTTKKKKKKKKNKKEKTKKRGNTQKKKKTDQATTPGVIPDEKKASLRRPPAQTFRIHPDFDAVCVWTQNACSVAHMWRTLGRVLGNQLLVAWVRKRLRAWSRGIGAY